MENMENLLAQLNESKYEYDREVETSQHSDMDKLMGKIHKMIEDQSMQSTKKSIDFEFEVSFTYFYLLENSNAAQRSLLAANQQD